MKKIAVTLALAISLVTSPAFAMCCGGKKVEDTSEAKMKCMKMDMAGMDMKKPDQSTPSEGSKAATPPAGMDMGSDARDGTAKQAEAKMAGCCCCGGKGG